MDKLFSENLGVTKNNKVLDTLVKKYPDYDKAYICQVTAFNRQDTRDWMEELWKLYEPHSDTNFLTEFKKHFTERSWELYLGATLILRGYHLEKHRNIGPDFKLEAVDKKPRSVWIEAVAATPGEGPDKMPEMKYGVAVAYPEEAMLLRLTNALKEKHNKYTSYIKNGVLKPDEPYVIAINRGDLGHLDPQIPLIFKCLFGIGHQTIFIKTEKPLPKSKGSTWSSRMKVNKISGSDVPMLIFQNPEYAGISAVIYTINNVLNSPRELDKLGSGFVIVHNPFAKNPLPKDFFNFGEEWHLKGGYLNRELIKNA